MELAVIGIMRALRAWLECGGCGQAFESGFIGVPKTWTCTICGHTHTNDQRKEATVKATNDTQFRTAGGATVTLTWGTTRWCCGGCRDTGETGRDGANGHAADCRAMPPQQQRTGR